MSEPCHAHGPVEASRDSRSAADEKRDLLLAETCGLAATMCAAMDAAPGFVPCGHAFSNLVEGAFAAVACDDSAALDQVIEGVRGRSEHVAGHRGVAKGEARFAGAGDAQSALALAAVRGVAADAYAAMRLGRMDDSVNVALARALRALGEGSVDHELLLALGDAAAKAFALAR